MPSSPSRAAFFASLTWDDLQAAFGSSIVDRGKSYQRCGAVLQLGQTQDGRLAAWVSGNRRYATVVEVSEGELRGRCSCPYRFNCKHAVAVTLEYLERLKSGKPVPALPDDDKRLTLARDDDGDDEEYRDDWEDGEDEDEDWSDEEEIEDADRREAQPRARSETAAPSRPKDQDAGRLRAFLQQASRENLISLVLDLAVAFPEVRRLLEDRRRAGTYGVQELVKAARRAIDEASAHPGWSNHWSGEGYRPDYSRVRGLFQLLLQRGAADALVELGRELFDAGRRQVEESQDEGETAAEIGLCLDVAFQALPQSSKTPAEQILWAIDLFLQDEYDLCQGLDEFWSREFPSQAWSEAADALYGRLKQLTPKKLGDDYTARHRRDRLSNYLIDALERAGRQDEIIPLCEQEAETTGAYVRLVERLIQAGRHEEAEAWIRRGAEATQKQFPGIAAQLRDRLRNIRIGQGNWKQVAADKAQEFFHSPSASGMMDLLDAAEKAGCRQAVEQAARHYLETGAPPQGRPRKTKGETIPAWPLPEPETPVADPPRYGHRRQPPFYEVLIDLALLDRDPQTALRWYDEARQNNRPTWGHDERIADAIADLHPDRSIAFWKKKAESEIARVAPSAYENAAVSLRKIRGTLESLGRSDEFKAYLAQLRQEHRRKTRLLEVLDRLESKPIVENF